MFFTKRGGEGRFSSLFKRRGGEEDEVEGGVKLKVWRRGGGGRVLAEYSVGLSKVYIVERGAQVFYEVEDPAVSVKELGRLVKALERVREEFDPWLYLDLSRREEAERDLVERLRKLGVRDEVSIYFAKRELLGFGPLDPVFRDRQLENVECMGPGKPLTVVHVSVGRVPTNMSFEREELDRLIQRLVFMSGKSLDYRNPKVDNALLPGVGRLTATMGGEISPEGSSFVVRIFPERPWTVVGLLSRNTLSPEIAAYLWLAVEFKLPILVAGDMGSGKTSYSNALLGLIPPDRRIGTAEDVPEFKVPHKNWQRYLTEEKRGVDLLELVKLLLRANVDYVVINEIRGEESHAWFQAISTGHGGITTIHADSIESVFNRLDKLGIPPSYLTSLAIVVFIKRVKVGGRIERRTSEVIDVVDPVQKIYNVLFKYDYAKDSYVVGDLWGAKSTKTILDRSYWTLEKLKSEYEKRVEFLKKLKEINAKTDINDVDKLFEYMLRFYRGWTIESVEGGERRRAAVSTTVPAPGRRPDWIIKISAPPGPKRILLKTPPGVEVLDASRVGGGYVLEAEGSEVELKICGFGQVEYSVETGGRVLKRGVLTLLPTVATPQVSPGEKTARAVTEAKVVDMEATMVKSIEERTIVLDFSTVGALCIKFIDSGRFIKLEEGVYGRDILNDPTVSRRHFKIERREGKFYIVDLGSTNGTFINGVKLRPGEPHLLEAGYGISFGKLHGVVVPC
ncbi:MAG: ATPase, T2SS/T4P/T4SS family [Pyrobaculum sp.]